MTVEAPSRIMLRTNIFKGCQRCGGTLHIERDLDSLLDPQGVSYVCLQCGRNAPLASGIAQVRAATEGHAHSW